MARNAETSPRAADPPLRIDVPARLRTKDLLSVGDLSPDEILLVLDTAEAMKEVGTRSIKKVPALRGRTVVNLFFEPSTRTRTSFEIAEKRLSADTVNIAATGSSVSKGETLADTVRNLEAMAPDLIVLRHASAGAGHLAARLCGARVINAGDGMHEHPTQALLDAFTIRGHKGGFAGLRVAIVGDLLHSRVFRSNLLLLRALGADVRACGPATLMLPDMARLGARATTSVDEAVAGADVVMLLRVQLERMRGHFFPSLREYFQRFGMTEARLRGAAPDAIVMHPGPMNRGVEIAPEVADGSRSVILEQAANGIAVRMAVLYLLAESRRGEPEPEPAPGGSGLDAVDDPGARQVRVVSGPTPGGPGLDAAEDRERRGVGAESGPASRSPRPGR